MSKFSALNLDSTSDIDSCPMYKKTISALMSRMVEELKILIKLQITTLLEYILLTLNILNN